MSDKKSEELKDYLEDIYYSLKIIDSEEGKDGYGKKLIAETIIKLPKGVRNKLFEGDGVIFIFSYSSAGFVRSLNFMKPILKDTLSVDSDGNKYLQFEQPIIFLNFNQMRKGREKDAVAHEIAHFFLGHYKMKKIIDPRCEREADDLTEKWGFRRSYTEKDYKRFEKRRR